MNLFFVVFRSFVLLLNSVSKLIDNQCTCKLIIKTTAAYVCAHEQLLHLCFYVLVHYLLSLVFTSEKKIIQNYTKKLFTSLNFGKYSLSLWRIIVK